MVTCKNVMVSWEEVLVRKGKHTDYNSSSKRFSTIATSLNKISRMSPAFILQSRSTKILKLNVTNMRHTSNTRVSLQRSCNKLTQGPCDNHQPNALNRTTSKTVFSKSVSFAPEKIELICNTFSRTDYCNDSVITVSALTFTSPTRSAMCCARTESLKRVVSQSEMLQNRPQVQQFFGSRSHCVVFCQTVER